MLYHYNGDTFKLVDKNGVVKLYHKAETPWNSGWTYIGKFNSIDKAQASARQYTFWKENFGKETKWEKKDISLHYNITD